MKFGTQFAVAALALGASAARLHPVTNVVRSPPTVVERDIATITSVIADVGTGIDGLDKEVKAFSGDDGAMTKAAESLISTLKSGTSTVEASDDLTLNDALGLTSVVQDLQKKADALVEDLKSKKSDIEGAGKCSSVRQQTSDISTASKALIKAIVSKVPEEAQSIAKDLSAGLTKSLEDAESTFAEGSCTDKQGGGGGGDGGATTSAGNGGGDGGASTEAPAPTTSAGNGGGAGGYPTESPTTSAGEGTTPSETPSGGYTAVPSPTGGNNGTTTGSQPTTTAPVPAGAAVMGAPFGAAVLAAAVALL